MKKVIQVSNLVKKYGVKKAVDDLSFDVEEGSLFAFLGSNGAGKTTAISIITTSLKYDGGEVYVDGLKLGEDNDKIRNTIGIVFQGSHLDDLLTVDENLITRGSFYYKDRKQLMEKVDQITKLLKLEDYKKQRYGTLSGGERRRVDIARALLHEPKILFLDEPTTGLDPANRRLVWEIIKKLQMDKKITVFLTTHYMEEANDSDIVGIIDKGKLIAYDTPSNLKIKYSTDTIKLKLKDNKLKITEKHDWLHDEVIIKTKSSIEGLDIVNKYRNNIVSLEILGGNMDDVFLNVTGSKIKGGE